ncbi:unnamed protein product [Malus baccata var. baccata]
MAATASSMAATTVFIPRFPIKPIRCSALPYLPPRLSSPSSFPLKSFSGSRRLSLQVRASSSEETSTSVDTDELISDLKAKWDAVENKSTVLLYGGGAIVAVWLSSIVVGAVNSVPLVSDFFGNHIPLGFSVLKWKVMNLFFKLQLCPCR